MRCGLVKNVDGVFVERTLLQSEKGFSLEEACYAAI